MPRSNRPRGFKKNQEDQEDLRLDSTRTGYRRTETKRGVEYTVQTTSGGAAEADKTWMCPHCNISITKGLNHVVAWDSVRGTETRRHFHNACWTSFQGALL